MGMRVTQNQSAGPGQVAPHERGAQRDGRAEGEDREAGGHGVDAAVRERLPEGQRLRKRPLPAAVCAATATAAATTTATAATVATATAAAATAAGSAEPAEPESGQPPAVAEAVKKCNFRILGVLLWDQGSHTIQVTGKKRRDSHRQTAIPPYLL